MKRVLLLSAALCASLGTMEATQAGTGAPSAAPAQADVRKYQQLFNALWTTVNKNFYDPKMNGVDFVAVRERYRPLFAAVSTDAQFLDLGNKMIRELGTSHLDVIPPAGYWESIAGPATGVISQRFRRNGNIISYEASATGLAAEGLRPGDELVSPPEQLNGPLGTSGTIRVRGCDGSEREVTVAYRAPQSLPFHQRSTISGPAGRKVAYARIERFNDDTIAFADDLIAGAGDTDGMIIDVRGNSGGSITALYLANYFATGSRPTVTLVGRKVLARLGRMPTAQDIAAAPKSVGRYRFRDVLPQLMKHGQLTFYSEGRGEKGYRKPVTVLVNGRTGSAAEGFAFMMKELTPAKVVGRPSAGALIRGQEFKLPFGWQVTVPVFGLWSPDGISYIDRKVVPDVPVEFTRQDRCSGRDADIDAAIKTMFSGAN
jgi:carboxyl-terminal processing protease